MIKKYSYHIVLGLIILVFISLKWASLSLPYFWDEAWSYIPAISEMAKDVPCLLPGCIGIDFYRGHPLFFYFMASIWMKCIGSSLFSMHVFAMTISVLVIFSFFRLSRLVFSPRWALFASGLLILQEVFYVQSSFVLPEVLIMLLTMESIWSYLKNRKIYFLCCAGLIGLTKETGLMIIFGFIIFHLFRSKGIRRDAAWICIPVIPALLYYGLQKMQMGWFFYPLHLDLIDFSIGALKSKTGIILSFLFMDQGRKIFLIALAGLTVYELLRQTRRKYILPVMAIIGLTLFMILTKNVYGSLLLTGLFFFYYAGMFDFTGIEKQLIALSGILFFLVIIFSAFNFLMLRYLLLTIPLLILVLLIGLQKVVPKALLYQAPISIFMALYFMYSMVSGNRNNLWHDDVSINYINMVKVHQEVMHYCEQQNWYDKKIFTHFLLQQDLTNPELGYLTSSIPFQKANYLGEIRPDDDIVIFSCIEFDEGKYIGVKANPRYQLMLRVENHNAWSEIYTLNEITN